MGTAGAGVELIEAGVGRECIEDLPSVGQVDAEVADIWVTERHDVAIDDPVPLLDEMSDRMPTCLATAPGEEDSHAQDGTDPISFQWAEGSGSGIGGPGTGG